VPLYDYDCAACGRRFEVIHGVNDAGPERCPLCGSGPVRKAFAAPAIHFKGSGWAKKERRAAVKGKASSDDSDTGSDGEASSRTPEKTSEKSADKSPEESSTGSTASSESGTTSSPASSSPGSSD
jgi:putative FmdB family regulatory protein